MASRQEGVDLRGCRLNDLVGPRQIDPHGGAAAGFAVDADATAGLHHEAVDHAEAKSGSPPGGLGGEERFEGALPYLRRHALAGIAD